MGCGHAASGCAVLQLVNGSQKVLMMEKESDSVCVCVCERGGKACVATSLYLKGLPKVVLIMPCVE